MRGKGVFQQFNKFSTRITPAYAGKSVSVELTPEAYEDHPRVCGEKW